MNFILSINSTKESDEEEFVVLMKGLGIHIPENKTDWVHLLESLVGEEMSHSQRRNGTGGSYLGIEEILTILGAAKDQKEVNQGQWIAEIMGLVLRNREEVSKFLSQFLKGQGEDDLVDLPFHLLKTVKDSRDKQGEVADEKNDEEWDLVVEADEEDNSKDIIMED